ncbi:LysM peptidoglycan-binding domain-containing protein [Alicyclobacillus tolerans]|uniref:glycosyl hydrolase family 18 protein n=1 Tax=Alicyclobacillus tolerans TaxID=90970 RepID=UPI001F001474|nr:glycosyl hydrolase family 18 protein [Alicyclobacillus tolerans]MCF8564298.1 LysM peptidoglycan-binding domain-containing protein [Alicyclobacillus tolerans]
MEIHVVQEGESLFRVAQRYGVAMTSILQVNRLPSASLVPGQSMLIPNRFFSYIVMPGDTLFNIASQYGVSVNSVVALNPQVQTQNLIPGAILRLPAIQRQETMALGFLSLIRPDIDQTNASSFGPYNTYIGLFGYGMDAGGSIVFPQDQPALSAIQQTTALPAAVFSNWTGVTFSQAAVRFMLSNPSSRTQYISQMLNIVNSKGYRAVVIDFESLRASDSQGFEKFLQELSARLEPLYIPLIVAVMPVTSPQEARRPLLQAYNYETIARYATYLMLMAYNWHWATAAPGPIAPLYQVEQTIQYALSVVSRQQLLLGMIRYGYDWRLPHYPQEAAGVLGVQDAIAIAVQRSSPIRFDTASMSPWVYYTNAAGEEHVIWFEDLRSVQLKLQLLLKYQLRGIAVWEMNQNFPQFIPLLLNNFRIMHLQ